MLYYGVAFGMKYMKRREDEMKQTVVSLICMDMRDESRRTWYETENGTSSAAQRG